MRILLVNDDGWDAAGLATLRAVAMEFGEVRSVAPLDKRSGCGHQLTFDRPLNFVECGENAWNVDGMPADCVRVAVARMGPFDWVLSGINDGANLGVDIFHSGTVAAAREAMTLGLSALAISQYRKSMHTAADWSAAAVMCRRVLQQILDRSCEQGKFWNVNLPAMQSGAGLDAVVLAERPCDPSPLPMDYEHRGNQSRFCGVYRDRPRRPGSDIEACFGGEISLSLIGN